MAGIFQDNVVVGDCCKKFDTQKYLEQCCCSKLTDDILELLSAHKERKNF